MDELTDDQRDQRSVSIREQYFPDTLTDDPDWEGAGRVHDWRNHVGPRTQAIWPSLTREQRIAIYLDADDRASNEVWD